MIKNQIHYKYKEKEINTPTSKGYLTDFNRTKDWIEWLQKELNISETDWEKEQFNIQFKNTTTQLEYIKLLYTNEEAKKMEWGKDENDEFVDMITWPPIYLHPLMEDWFNAHCEDCGLKTKYNVRNMKEDIKGKSQKMSWCMVICKKCGGIGKIDKECIYRICEEHMGEGRHFWIEAWQKLGVKV